jgi:hypothetical protein
MLSGAKSRGFGDKNESRVVTALALSRNKLDKAGGVVVQRNKPEWLSYFVTMPLLRSSFLLSNHQINLGC